MSQKYAFSNNLIVFFAIALPKISICFAYLRIFYFDRVGRRLIQGLMVLLVLLIVPFFVETLLSCTPIHVYWSELRPDDKCLQDLATLYVSGGMNALVDISMMCILIPRILHLNMEKRQKIMLLGIVSLGLVAVVAAIVRMIRVGNAIGAPSNVSDLTWDTYDVTIWTSTEIYISLVCASAPGVKPLISMLLPHLLGTTLRSRTRTTGGRSYGTYGSGPIELSGKMKRKMLTTTVTMHGSVSAAELTTGSGPWIEVGRGTDEENPEIMSDEESYHERLRADGGIVKKSEITVHTAQAINFPVPSPPLEELRKI
jgi:hypothetical protein